MRVFVTGASGMVGANLCRALVESGVPVRIYSRKPVRHPLLEGLPLEESFGDLNDADALRAAMSGCTHAYHVAGVVSYRDRDRDDLYRTNVLGTQNVLQAAAAAGVQRVVHTSSTAAVGICRGNEPPLNEDSSFRPEDRRVPYMATKREAEDFALAIRGVEVVAVNPATIYGKGDVKLNTGTVFQKISAGKLGFCPPGGTAVVSVQDCVSGHILAMQRGQPGRRYILASGNHSYVDLFAAISRALGVPPPHRVLPGWLYPPAALLARLWDAATYGMEGAKFSRHVLRIAFSRRYFDSTRARQELGWQPAQSLDEMFADAVEFYRANGLL